jgi:putative colanic acid biosynthesis acetyltransferase WcaF
MDLKNYDQSHYSRGRPNWYIALWWIIRGTVFRLSLQNMYGIRNIILRLFGAKIGSGVKIRPNVVVTYPWKVEIGENSWIGDNVELYSLDKITIGSNCSISQRSYICTGSHDYCEPKFTLITKPVIIEDNVWIGTDCFINLGVVIGQGSVIGARSSVFKSVDPMGVYYGSPVKFIKKREINKNRS